jgi:hypothetical protein
LWSFTAAAQTDGRVLVDMNPFLLRDALNAGARMRPGTYRLDAGRSAIFMEMTNSFPTNTELEAELTFVQQPGGGGGGGFGFGNPAFEGVGSVAASGAAATIRIHHSFVELPDDNYTTREYDSRAGYGAATYQDYATPLGEDMTKRFIRRHRLEKRNPNAAISDPVEPIIYYLDPGTPEPVRSALLDGARWWNQAFEAAGYRNAFQVVMRPDSISSLDARYNVINWVHRSTRGWSTGGSVTDPRTGEIIKGVVTLGSLRIRQDYLIAEGLLSPYQNGDEAPPELQEWAVARIRQLSAHEVGHTIGLGHNYYNSSVGRISVMDYPHPLITLENGRLDYSEVYDVGMGGWDIAAVEYGYQDFPAGTNENAELQRILKEAWDQDVRYMTGQDVATTPQADQWANGEDMAAELKRMMDVRSFALERFGTAAIRNGTPMAKIEEALVPLYLHHRYQLESTASQVGGVKYVYATRGDGLAPMERVPNRAQRDALDALIEALHPSQLTIPTAVLDAIPPRPPGYRQHREMFPRYTGGSFDAITPAVVLARHVIGSLLNPARGARLVQQHAIDPSLPGLEQVIEELLEGTFGASTSSGYEAEIKRAVERVVVDGLMSLASRASMPQVRAMAEWTLIERKEMLETANQPNDDAKAHASMLARDIGRFLERDVGAVEMPGAVSAPPGAPIGDPGMDWLNSWQPWCTWEDHGNGR